MTKKTSKTAVLQHKYDEDSYICFSQIHDCQGKAYFAVAINADGKHGYGVREVREFAEKLLEITEGLEASPCFQ